MCYVHTMKAWSRVVQQSLKDLFILVLAAKCVTHDWITIKCQVENGCFCMQKQSMIASPGDVQK